MTASLGEAPEWDLGANLDRLRDSLPMGPCVRSNRRIRQTPLRAAPQIPQPRTPKRDAL